MGSSTSSLTSRFTNVDTKLGNLDTSINTIGTNLNNISNKVIEINNTINDKIVNNIGTSTDDETKDTLFGRLAGVNKKIDTISNTTTETKNSVTELSNKLGTSTDNKTIFEKINTINETVNNNKEALSRIESALATISSNTNLKTVTSATIDATAQDLADYLSSNPGVPSSKEIVEKVTNFLHQRGYLK